MKFHTLPHKLRYKDYVKCFVCGWFADELGLLKEFHRRDDYNDRLLRLEKYRKDYARIVDDDGAGTQRRLNGEQYAPTHSGRRGPDGEPVSGPATYGTIGGIFFPVETTLRTGQQSLPALSTDTLEAIRELEDAQVQLLADAAALIRSRCPEVNVVELLVGCYEQAHWLEESDQRHREQCTDADCQAGVCRAARGLPPLSQEERQQMIEEAQRQRRAMQERCEAWADRCRRRLGLRTMPSSNNVAR
jgi:hypothetical protein